MKLDQHSYLKELDEALEKIGKALVHEHYIQASLILGMLMGVVKQSIAEKEIQKENEDV